MTQQPPPPQYPPQQFFHQEPETMRGLKWQSWALAIFMIMTIVSMVLALVLFFMVNSLVTGSTNPSDVIGSLILLLAVSLMLLVLGILVMVFWFLGYYHVYKGKEEFGQPHSNKVGLSLKLLIAYLIIYLVGFIAGIVTMPLFVFGTTMTPQQMFDRIFLNTLVTGTIGLVGGIVLSFHIIYPVMELLDHGYRKRLWIGFALNLAAMIVTFIIMIWLISSLSSVISTLNLVNISTAVNGFTSAASVAAIITFVAYILWFSCYRKAFSRIESGELKPVPRPVQQYGYPGAYPGYAPGYPPPPR
jgi:hypothetical protein